MQFVTHEHLALALKARPSLLRCGCMPAPGWRGVQAPCGPAKHLLPEMLQLQVVPSPQAQVATYADLHSMVNTLLKAMALQSDGVPSFWFPSSHAPGKDTFPLRAVSGLHINVLCSLTSEEELAAASRAGIT